jgi:hypothetical protein
MTEEHPQTPKPTPPTPEGIEPSIEPIRQATARAERRLRVRRALGAGAVALCVALTLACVAIALRKTGLLGEASARRALLLLAATPLAAALVAYARRLDALPWRAGALALDRFHGLSDRLSSALAFSREPSPSPFMFAAIDDAVAHAPSLDPARAVPIHAPPHLGAAFGLACALTGIALFEVRHHEPAAHVATIDAVDVTADDLDAMRDFLDQMKAREQTDEAKAATREFNQLIEDLAARRLDRTEAFRRMQQLEDKLLEGREADAKALEDAMKKIGDEMKGAELTKPAGEALESQNLAVAEKKLHDLAAKLRDGKGPDKSQLDKMREALKRASSSQSKRQEMLAQRREELRQQLLAQRNKASDAGASDEERSLLQKRERELERLDRETQQSEATGRQLDRLDRELAQAAEDLMKDLGLSANDLDKSAEDINRMQQQQMSQEEKEQLRQKLQELREMMRQQGQGGQGQMARLRRFQMQARGQSGGSQGGQQGQGQEGQGQEGQGQEGQGGQGQEGQGQQGQGQQGQGQQGQGGQMGGGAGKGGGSGGTKGEVWVMGPGGQKMLMLSQGGGGGSGGAGNGGGGDPGGGKGWGTSHDGHVEGKATAGIGASQNTQVAGQDTGQGASRSEVIEGAAERGFATRGYQKVFREYETVAEEAIAKDEIPGGYRFYVRRYFELIRPRDASEHATPPAKP